MYLTPRHVRFRASPTRSPRASLARIVVPALVFWLGFAARAAAAVPPGCPAPDPLAQERWAGESEWLAIQRAGLHYGKLDVKVHNVYDLANPSEEAWYTRAADFLHIRTRDWVVRNLLLIKPGATANAQQVYEAIRRLRRQGFFRAADITPVSCSDGTVNARVDVRDAWTLKLDTQFRRAGNSNQWRLRLVDANFLGTGRTLAVGHVQTLERSMNMLQYTAPTLLNTDWTLGALYEQLSDGRLAALTLAKPFLLNTTPWSASIAVLDQQLHLGFYNDGSQAWYLPQHEQYLQANWQRLLGFNGVTAWRAGVAVDYERYRYGSPVPVHPDELPAPVPETRTLAGVGPVVSMHQDRFASFENIRGVGRAEDYNLGWDASAQVLVNATALGATENGPNVSLGVSKGFEPFRSWLVLTDAAWTARRSGGIWRNQAFNLDATAYAQVWAWQTLVFHVDYASLLDPDPENRLYIGGADALRGYPNFYLTGSRRTRVTLADRIVTPIVWFHTFQVGFVVFIDNAQIERAAGQGWSPWYSTIGGGFRLGNLRGATNPVLYFTLALPVNAPPGVSRHPVFAVGDVVTF